MKGIKYLKSGIEIFLKLAIASVFLFPFLWLVSVALQTKQELNSLPLTLIPQQPQFQNIIEAWNSGPFLTYTKNSIIIIVSIIVLQMLIMLPAAYAFAKFEFKGKTFFFALVLTAFMIPSQVTFLPIYTMMSKWNLINSLIPQILPAMTNAFGIFLLRQYFMQIPNEIIESARLDNASTVQIIFKIMLPMGKPALATIVLFSFVSHWNEYFWPLIITNTNDVRPLTLGIAALRSTEGIVNWNIIMAGNLILVLPIVIIYFLCSKHIINAFAYSGIK